MPGILSGAAPRSSGIDRKAIFGADEVELVKDGAVGGGALLEAEVRRVKGADLAVAAS